MVSPDPRLARSLPSPALVRFIAEGLLAAVDSFLRGELPVPRLIRELAARTDELAELGPPARTLTRLRWSHREVARLAADPSELPRLAATLVGFRDLVVALTQPDSTGAASSAVPVAKEPGEVEDRRPALVRSAGA